MIKTILLTICLLPLLAFTQENFEIKGKIGSHNNPVMAYLKFTNNQRTDSAIIKKGEFSFKGQVQDPQMAVLSIRYKAGQNMLLPQDNLTIMIESGINRVRSSGSLHNAEIIGSQLNADLKELLAVTSADMQINQRTRMEMTMAETKGPEVKKEAWYIAKRDSAMQSFYHAIEVTRHFVATHPDSYISLDAFRSTMGSNVDSAEASFLKFSPRVRSTDLGKQIAESIAKMLGKKIGAQAIDFTQNDINGKPFTLSSLKGKYVLVDFWASWCKPCRAETPNVQKAYQSLKDKGLEIVSVSTDSDREAWEKAIKQDGMPWIHVSDLKGGHNEVAVKYGITAVPQNLLVSPEGIVIAVNVGGIHLDKQLAKLMKLD